MLPAFGFSYLLAIALCVHVVRTGREMYWIFIMLAFHPLGGLVYFVANVLPDIIGGSTARRIGQAARNALDPEREYRAAMAAVDDSPTVGNRMRLASAAASLGRAYHALGRTSEADTAYQWAEGRLPGLEGLARYVVFLAEVGRRAEAEEAPAEIDKRAAKTTSHFRKEARMWRDFAAEALG